MKWLLLFVVVFGCSRKYQNYTFINKKEFIQNQRSAGAESAPRLLAGKKEEESFCEGQILFNKNAEKITEASLPALVSQSCPGSDYLLQAKITRLWWSTIVYSRSCVKVESFCPKRTGR